MVAQSSNGFRVPPENPRPPLDQKEFQANLIEYIRKLTDVSLNELLAGLDESIRQAAERVEGGFYKRVEHALMRLFRSTGTGGINRQVRSIAMNAMDVADNLELEDVKSDLEELIRKGDLAGWRFKKQSSGRRAWFIAIGFVGLIGITAAVILMLPADFTKERRALITMLEQGNYSEELLKGVRHVRDQHPQELLPVWAEASVVIVLNRYAKAHGIVTQGKRKLNKKAQRKCVEDTFDAMIELHQELSKLAALDAVPPLNVRMIEDKVAIIKKTMRDDVKTELSDLPLLEQLADIGDAIAAYRNTYPLDSKKAIANLLAAVTRRPYVELMLMAATGHLTASAPLLGIPDMKAANIHMDATLELCGRCKDAPTLLPNSPLREKARVVGAVAAIGQIKLNPHLNPASNKQLINDLRTLVNDSKSWERPVRLKAAAMMFAIMTAPLAKQQRLLWKPTPQRFKERLDWLKDYGHLLIRDLRDELNDAGHRNKRKTLKEWYEAELKAFQESDDCHWIPTFLGVFLTEPSAVSRFASRANYPALSAL